VIASIIIAGLFAQARDLFVIAYASWLGLCVFVGALLDGNRAAGVVIAGFTVAFVAVIQIDSPQNIFLTGVNRGAVIAVGIAALALVNDVFLAPNLHAILSGKLGAVHQRVRAFAIAVLLGESADPIQSAKLLREITAFHPDISALVIESSAGWARGAAARTRRGGVGCRGERYERASIAPCDHFAITSQRACASPGQRAGGR
jgi:hypothetical protein